MYQQIRTEDDRLEAAKAHRALLTGKRVAISRMKYFSKKLLLDIARQRGLTEVKGNKNEIWRRLMKPHPKKQPAPAELFASHYR